MLDWYFHISAFYICFRDTQQHCRWDGTHVAWYSTRPHDTFFISTDISCWDIRSRKKSFDFILSPILWEFAAKDNEAIYVSSLQDESISPIERWDDPVSLFSFNACKQLLCFYGSSSGWSWSYSTKLSSLLVLPFSALFTDEWWLALYNSKQYIFQTTCCCSEIHSARFSLSSFQQEPLVLV